MTEHARLSARISAIAESATLKVDAKAKALQAEGRPVISYAAGEPDFATPDYIVEAALAATHDPKNYRYTPAAGLPELREAIAAKTLRDSGLEVSPGPGRRHERRQAGGVPGVPGAARPGRRGARADALLDHLPRGHQARRRRAGRRLRRRRPGLPRHGRPARGRPHRPHQGAALRLAVEPDRRGLLARAGREPSASGRSSTASGSCPTRSTRTSPTPTSPTACPRARCRSSRPCPSSRTRRSS